MIYPVTSKCNQRCIFCSAATRNDNDLNLNDFKKFLSKSDNLIVLSGGDPFSLPISKLIYIVSLCVKAGKTVEIQTNATQIPEINLSELKILVSLINKTDGYFNINIPSYKARTDYKITSLTGGFSKRMRAVLILKKLSVNIRITHVINKLNYKELPSFSNFVLSNKKLWDWVQFSFVKAMGRASDNRNVVPKYSSVSSYLIKAMKKLDDAKFKFDVDHIPLCFLGKFYDRHVDVVKLKNGIKGDYLKEKRKLKSCKGCKFYKICSGPRIDYIKIYGNL